MSLDLQQLFDREGLDAPTPTLDLALVVRRGRRNRVRRRVAAGTASVAGVALLGTAAVAVAGAVPHAAPVGSTDPATIDTGAPDGGGSPSPTPAPADRSLRATLEAITLADPAPGFPLQRSAVGRMAHEGLTASFSLGVTPRRFETASSGVVSGIPTGPEARIFIGVHDGPIHLLALNAPRELPGTPQVAGRVGHLLRSTEKGETFTGLWFTAGELTVEIMGTTGVTVDQLVALGNALGGLPPSP